MTSPKNNSWPLVDIPKLVNILCQALTQHKRNHITGNSFILFVWFWKHTILVNGKFQGFISLLVFGLQFLNLLYIYNFKFRFQYSVLILFVTNFKSFLPLVKILKIILTPKIFGKFWQSLLCTEELLQFDKRYKYIYIDPHGRKNQKQFIFPIFIA